MKVKSTTFAQAAIDALALGITYAQEDCQAFVEQTIKRAGGSMPDFRGSNDMFRNACDSVHPLDVSIREGLIAPGCVLFIVEQDGGEPERYKEDSLGNASHIGIYTGGTPEVVHSSYSRGGVVGSTLKNGWTHVGWLTAVDYLQDDAPVVAKPTAQVVADTGNIVRLRAKPSLEADTLVKVPVGSMVEVLARAPDWWQVAYQGRAGWMMREFVRLVEDGTMELPDEPPAQADIDRAALLVEMQGLLSRQQAIVKALMGVM